jgi:hypothetical protein
MRQEVKLFFCRLWRRTGGEGINLHSFFTSSVDGGERSSLRPGRPPGETILVPIEQEVGRASEPVLTLEKRKISCALEFTARIAHPILLSPYRLGYPVIWGFRPLEELRENAFHGFVESYVRLYFMNCRRPKIAVWCRHVNRTVSRFSVITISKKTGIVWCITWYCGAFALCLYPIRYPNRLIPFHFKRALLWWFFYRR